MEAEQSDPTPVDLNMDQMEIAWRSPLDDLKKKATAAEYALIEKVETTLNPDSVRAATARKISFIIGRDEQLKDIAEQRAIDRVRGLILGYIEIL